MTLKILNNSKFFLEIAAALNEALCALGVDCELVNTTYNEQDTYIIFTTHELNFELPKFYIAYNFEQLGGKRWPDQFFYRLKNAVQVWDYSELNVRMLLTKEIEAKFVPYGYAKCHTKISGGVSAKKQLDVVFLGFPSERRAQKLSQVEQVSLVTPKLYSYKQEYNCFGEDLIRLYSDSTIGLNVHYYFGLTILEVPRLIPMIANKVWVISEPSDDRWYDAKMTGCVTIVPADKFVLEILKVLNMNPEERDAEVNKRLEYLQTECSYESYLRPLIPSLLGGEK
jgi:hypothetical protein